MSGTVTRHDVSREIATPSFARSQLIKSTIRTRYNEHFAAWAGLALAMLLIDRLLVGGPLNRLP